MQTQPTGGGRILVCISRPKLVLLKGQSVSVYMSSFTTASRSVAYCSKCGRFAKAVYCWRLDPSLLGKTDTGSAKRAACVSVST